MPRPSAVRGMAVDLVVIVLCWAAFSVWALTKRVNPRRRCFPPFSVRPVSSEAHNLYHIFLCHVYNVRKRRIQNFHSGSQGDVFWTSTDDSLLMCFGQHFTPWENKKSSLLLTTTTSIYRLMLTVNKMHWTGSLLHQTVHFTTLSRTYFTIHKSVNKLAQLNAHTEQHARCFLEGGRRK